MSNEHVSRALERALRAHCRGRLLVTGDTKAPFSIDFGGILRRFPLAVFEPENEGDLRMALRIATDHGVSVTTRGSGHSQSGQGLGTGLLLHLKGFGGPPHLNEATETLEVGAGSTWREATDLTLARGFLPRALTHMLDATIGGTLSVGGIGSESWRFGPQVDNVLWLDVMTLDGLLVRCSATSNRELFDAIRGGLGQCGVIVRVGYPLRRCRSLLRTRSFVYRDAATFHADVHAVSADREAKRLLAGAIVNDPTGSGERVLLLCVGEEFDDPAELDETSVPHLGAALELPSRHTRVWRDDGLPGHVFFQTLPRRDPLINDGAIHPWVDHLFADADAPAMLEALRWGSHGALDHGTLGLIWVRRGQTPAPLLVTPDDDVLTWELGMFTAFAERAGAQATSTMQELVALVRPFGGKRYLSSFQPFEWQPCPAHYGGVWSMFAAAKRRWNPLGLLNPDFIDWSDAPSE